MIMLIFSFYKSNEKIVLEFLEKILIRLYKVSQNNYLFQLRIIILNLDSISLEFCFHNTEDKSKLSYQLKIGIN